MKIIHSIFVGTALSIAAGLPALANPSLSVSASSALGHALAAGVEDVPVLKVAHKSRRHGGLDKGLTQGRRVYRRHHRRFHKRYNPRHKNYPRSHRRFHRHYGRRHRSPGFTFRIYPGYDPFYYNPYYYDPYYDAPYVTPRGYNRLSCARVRALLRRHGYRHVRAYDCKGKVYGFYVRYKGRRYKVRASAYSGQVVSRRPI